MPNKGFEFSEDLKFFQKRFPQKIVDDEKLFMSFFDFRDPKPNGIKRKEFNKIKKSIKKNLIDEYGEICQLGYNDIDCRCDLKSGIEVDHFIPISTNKLNKNIRRIGINRDNRKLKKAITQSFGSNNTNNLIIACKDCNRFKQNKIPTKDIIEKVLKKKGLI